ncbi:MAG: DUF1553 domain-containing protein [Planctomycetes bacterium]|nr:DUF1553 domain-containing protein [Planctomycetota bacterium]
MRRPPIPAVKHPDRVRTPVDAFLLSKLEAKGLSFAPEASPEVLVRRAYFDLIGLPPSPEELESFLTDPIPDPCEKLIDSLLASPHFGERWGRHWLDVAGYVDVNGADENAPTIRQPPGKHRYRDYVIESFNQDKPYNQFLIEQLAGDELVDWRIEKVYTQKTIDLLVATGFLRTAVDDTDQDVLNIPSNRHATLYDTMEIVGSSVFGLTLQCARCHSHKFEPIPQEDYYRLMAVFTPAYNPEKWVQLPGRALPDVGLATKAEIEAHNAEVDRQVKSLKDRLGQLFNPYRENLFAKKLAALPEPIREDTRIAVQTPPDKRNEVQKYLAGKFEASLNVKEEEVVAALSEADRAAKASFDNQIAKQNSRRRQWAMIQALWDTGPPPETRLLVRGEYTRPGKVVKPGGLGVLCDSGAAGSGLAPSPDAKGQTSGLRLALARWATKPDTAAGGLVARVHVNRLWHYLFGRGIVTTPGNLGRSGAPPGNAELLNWLAGEFVQNGWRLKPLLKLIMSSSVYRQSSAIAKPGGNPDSALADPASVDPANEFLWRMPLRRLQSEIVRDHILAASGNLDRTMGGPPVPLEIAPGERIVVATNNLPAPTSAWRRSVYLLGRRNYNVSMLSVFDQPVISINCACRNSSTVVLQTLTLLNDAFVFAQADSFAKRVEKEAGSDLRRRIDRAFRIAFSRPPFQDEVEWSFELLNNQAQTYIAAKVAADDAERKALANLCHMILNSNEFLYVK